MDSLDGPMKVGFRGPVLPAVSWAVTADVEGAVTIVLARKLRDVAR